jgi:hypothetical protein
LSLLISARVSKVHKVPEVPEVPGVLRVKFFKL